MFKQYFQATWEELWVQEWKTPIYRRPRFTAAFSMFPRAAVNRGFTVVGNWREPGINGGLWMLKDEGRDLEGRSWRKGVEKSSRGEPEEARAMI